MVRGPVQKAVGTFAKVLAVELASRPLATVSTPYDLWGEVEGRARAEDFRIDNAPARVQARGDLWKPLLLARGRTELDRILQGKGRGSRARS